jgi:hypothetical protein
MPTPAPRANPSASIALARAEKTGEQVDISIAMRAVRDGKKVRRAVWYGDHYIFKAKRDELTVENKGDAEGYLAQHHVNGTVDAMILQDVDIDAEDWEIVS